jgi:hypothetical protein
LIKDGGYLILTTTNKSSYKKYLQRVLSRHRTFYSSKLSETINEINLAGFDVVNLYGYNWLPFKRDSNNPLIGLFELIEKLFWFQRLASVSPYVFIVAKKR